MQRASLNQKHPLHQDGVREFGGRVRDDSLTLQLSISLPSNYRVSFLYISNKKCVILVIPNFMTNISNGDGSPP
jgi:hypothetical protein